MRKRFEHNVRTKVAAEGFNGHNVDDVLGLYDNDAVIVVEPGSTVTGRDAIRALLTDFLAIGGEMQIETVDVLESAGTALLKSHWTIEGKGPDGSPVSIESRGTEVVRRTEDGSWRFVIDNPFDEQSAAGLATAPVAATA